MDIYNYDVERVKKCNIHYALPGGRPIPFCAFNVLQDYYREEVQKKFSKPITKADSKVTVEYDKRKYIDTMRKHSIYFNLLQLLSRHTERSLATLFSFS
ncbi:MAG: hypothetical protein QXN05_04185 [Acidilobaceae archaeon]